MQCAVCGKATSSCCSKCEAVYYCAAECQKRDWTSHRKVCDTLSKPKSVNLHSRALIALQTGLLRRFGTLRDAYRWYDLNQKGQMSLKEFEKSLEAAGFKASNESVSVSELFAALDDTGSGGIDVGRLFHASVRHNVLESDSPISLPPPASQADRKAVRTAAILAFRNGNYQEAIALSEKVLSMSTPSNENLPDFLLLARAMLLTGETEKGRKFADLCVSILDDQTRPISDLHTPQIVSTLIWTIAETVNSYGMVSVGDKIAEDFLCHTRRHFGEDSLVTGDAYTIAASHSFRNNDFDTAVKHSEIAKKIREKHLPYPHARIADAFCNFALVLKSVGRSSEAVQHYKAALAQREKLFGPSNLLVADIQFSLGQLLISSQEEADRGVNLLKTCQQIRNKLLGPIHPDTIAVNEAISLVHIDSRKVNKVEISTNPVEDVKTQTNVKSRVLPLLLISEGKNPKIINPEAIACFIDHRVPLPSMVGTTIFRPSDISRWVEKGIPPVLPLLDERTGRKFRDHRGDTVELVNPALCMQRGFEDDRLKHNAAGIWKGANGCVEVVDKNGTPIMEIESLTVPIINPIKMTTAETEVAPAESRSANRPQTFNISDSMIFEDNDLEKFASKNYLLKRLEKEGADNFAMKIARCDQSLIENIDIDPMLVFNELPSNQKSSEMRRFRFMVTYLCCFSNIPLEADGKTLLTALREVKASEKFLKILRSLAKIAVSLGKSNKNDKLNFSILSGLLEIKGDQISLSEYFGDAMRTQRPDLLSFNKELSLALKLSAAPVEKNFNRMELFIEVQKKVDKLKNFCEEVPLSDPLSSKSEYIKSDLPLRVEKVSSLKNAIVDEFLELRNIFGLTISGKPLGAEIGGFFVNLRKFTDKIAKN